MVEERDRIVAKLANTQVSLPDLLAVQADAKAYIKLRNELERAIGQGSTDSE